MSKALALALACHGVAAWTASDASIRSAVRLWLSDKSAAEVKYGHISTWETGGVTDMDFLFCVRTDWIDAEYEDEDNFLDPCVLPASASSFNDGISAWDTSSVTTMKLMFHGASAFNQPLNDWRVDKVTNMNGMFLQAAAFDQPLNDWWVDKVTSMVGMFHDALSFNQDISGWRVENVTNMYIMFAGARSFNRPLGDWRVDKVTDMSYMFREASAFNQPLGDWNVDKVTDMHGMFYKAKGFRQDLGWCVNDDVNMKYAFQKSRCEWTSCGVMQKKRYELEQCVYTGKSYTLLMVFVISFVGALLVALVVNDGTLEGLFYRTPVRYSGVGSDDEGIEMSGSSVATGSNLAAATTYVMLRGFPMTRLALNLYKYRVRILTSIKAIVDYGKDKPWWVARFVAVCLGNPLAFFGYFGYVTQHHEVLGITAFKDLGGNIFWMNPLLFVAVTFPIYLLWVLFNVEAIRAVTVCSDRSFDANNYFETYTPRAAAVAIPGLLNLLVWGTSGMEGNVFGFMFFLPLLIAQVLYLAMWVYALCSSCFVKNQYNNPSGTDDLSQTSMV